jgi:hypothetical protein
MAKRILIRRDTTANWQAVNPILSNGELGIEFKSDGTKSIKLGTGAVPWNSLPYFIDNPATISELNSHTNNTAAHRATATPSPSLIAMYNSAAGLKSDKTPEDLNDVLRKTELDGINDKISGITDDVNDLDDDLAAEVTNRTNADGTLQDGIDDVASGLATETTNRTDADSGLQDSIDDLTTALATEVTNRTDADGALQDSIDDVASDLATEISNRQTAVSDAISTASTDATNKADTAESNAKQYADDLALATQKWLPAVETSAELPASPGPGTYLCRVVTGSDYGVYQWIGTEVSPSWTYFSDNLDFIDRIANPVTNNIPIITANGELIDSGENLSGIASAIATKEPSKHVAADETAAQTYSASNPTVMVFYPEA